MFAVVSSPQGGDILSSAETAADQQSWCLIPPLSSNVRYYYRADSPSKCALRMSQSANLRGAPFHDTILVIMSDAVAFNVSQWRLAAAARHQVQLRFTIVLSKTSFFNNRKCYLSPLLVSIHFNISQPKPVRSQHKRRGTKDYIFCLCTENQILSSGFSDQFRNTYSTVHVVVKTNHRVHAQTSGRIFTDF